MFSVQHEIFQQAKLDRTRKQAELSKAKLTSKNYTRTGKTKQLTASINNELYGAISKLGVETKR